MKKKEEAAAAAAKVQKDEEERLKQEKEEMKKKKTKLEEALNELKRDQKKNTDKAANQLESKLRTLDDMKKSNDLQIQTLPMTQRLCPPLTTPAAQAIPRPKAAVLGQMAKPGSRMLKANGSWWVVQVMQVALR